MAGEFDFIKLADCLKRAYSIRCVDIRFNPSSDRDWFFWVPQPIAKRDDSGIPDWLRQSNETYFRELHRTVDDVSAPMGVRVSK